MKDWYYGNSPNLHMAMFSLPPGGIWRHSDQHKSYYYADECDLLLAGELTIHNPENGDVAVVRAGESLHFRERTWHYGYNEWAEMHPRDGCFIRAGTPHRWYNTTAEPASGFFGVAPKDP